MISTYRLAEHYKKKEILIPFRGEWNIYVKEGDVVKKGDIIFDTTDRRVIQSFYLPQELGIKPDESSNYICRVDGEFVMPKEVLAERVIGGGLTIKTLYSDKEGIIDYSRLSQGFIDILSEGDMEQVVALFDGVVTKIDKKLGVYIEAPILLTRPFYFANFEKTVRFEDIDSLAGRFTMVADGSSVYSAQNLKDSYHNEIVWGGKFIYPDLASAILERGAKLVLAYSMDYEDFKKVDFPLIITGGFGHIPLSKLYLQFWKQMVNNFVKIDLQTRRLVIAGDSIALYGEHKEICTDVLKVGDKVRSLDWNHWGEIGLVADVLDKSVSVKFNDSMALIPDNLLQKFVS